MQNYEPFNLIAREQRLEQFHHGITLHTREERSHMLPHPFLAAFLLPDSPEEGTGKLEYVIDQKGEHHEQGKDDRYVLLSMPILMLTLRALIFERLIGLMFDLPSCSPPPCIT